MRVDVQWLLRPESVPIAVEEVVQLLLLKQVWVVIAFAAIVEAAKLERRTRLLLLLR